MARTVQEVLTSARLTANDSAGTRCSDAELIGYVLDALNMAKQVRPDLFVGRFSTAFGTLVLTTALPLDDQYFRPVTDYVIARMETKDDEHVVNARAELMAKMAGEFMR